jgi:hypothetical protein
MTDPRNDPSMKAVLDRFTVPSLPEGFADRIVALAVAEPVPEPAPLPRPRRDPRGGWRRPSRIFAGAMAFGLVSAAAAATGYLGDRAQTVVREAPVIGPMIAQVVPTTPKPAAKAKPSPVRAQVTAPAIPDAPEIAVPEIRPVMPLSVRREVRREIIAERIASGLERRAERRAELGLSARPPRLRDVAPVLRRIPPADRRAVIERVREIRQERAAAALEPRLGRPVVAEDSPLPVTVTVPQLDGHPVAAVEPDAQQPAANGEPRSAERIEQLRRLRELRELRRRRLEARRQRQQ